ncbi:alpha/beta hydrolase [soil metagenome]
MVAPTTSTPTPGVYWPKDRTVVTSDGATVHFTVLGERGPAVILLSGFLCPDTWWYHLAPALVEAGYRVVLLHYRGIATSTLPTRPDERSISIERFAEDALDVLHAAGIGQVSLIGHSMGGQVMVEVARRIPDRVTAMVSVTGTYRSPLKDLYGHGWAIDPLAGRLLWGLQKLREPVGTTVWRTVWRTVPFLPLGRLVTAFSAKSPADIILSYEQHAASLSGEYFTAVAAAMRRHDPGDLLPSLDIPTLVITGDADPFTPLKTARRMVELLPDATLVIVPGASHGCILEEPEVVNTAILEHLAGHDPVEVAERLDLVVDTT